MIRKFLFYALFGCLGLVVWACPSANTNQKTTEDTLKTKTSGFGTQTLSKGQILIFKATTANNIPLQFILVPSDTNIQGQVTFPKKRTSLILYGKRNPTNDSIYLEHWDTAKVKLQFKGVWSANELKLTMIDGTLKKKENLSLIPIQLPYSITSKNVFFETQNKKAVADLCYPYFESNRYKTQSETFNQVFESKTLASLPGIKKEYEDLSKIKTPLNVQYELKHNYNVHLASPSVLSLTQFVYSYMGGAHGFHGTNAYTFAIESNQELKITDIFDPQKDYLNFLSRHCKNELAMQYQLDLNNDLLVAGTAPINENFKTFYFTPFEMVFIMAPYQVGPYSIGEPQIRIPFALLSPYLKANSVIETIVKEQ